VCVLGQVRVPVPGRLAGVQRGQQQLHGGGAGGGCARRGARLRSAGRQRGRAARRAPLPAARHVARCLTVSTVLCNWSMWLHKSQYVGKGDGICPVDRECAPYASPRCPTALMSTMAIVVTIVTTLERGSSPS
jgi:hypothetical protein